MMTGPRSRRLGYRRDFFARDRDQRMRGQLARVTNPANRSRSTASAAPAGTRLASAARMISEPRRRISSFRRPTALSSLSPRKELLQTSSARPIGLVDGRRPDRPHFVERNGNASRGRLPSCFRARQTAANDADHSH